MSKILIIVGIIVFIVGVLFYYIPFVGKLPGDIVVMKGEKSGLYVPIVSCIVISIILSIILTIIFNLYLK